MENSNYIMREITPLSDRDCFYIADRRKTEFTYPIHCHAEFELNFTEHAAGVRRVNPEKPDVPLNKNDAFQKVQKRRVQEKR